MSHIVMMKKKFDLSDWLSDESPYTGMELTLACTGEHCTDGPAGSPDNWFEPKRWDIELHIRKQGGYVTIGVENQSEQGIHDMMSKEAPGYTEELVNEMLEQTISDGTYIRDL